jgi:hypothetical protein
MTKRGRRPHVPADNIARRADFIESNLKRVWNTLGPLLQLLVTSTPPRHRASFGEFSVAEKDDALTARRSRCDRNLTLRAVVVSDDDQQERTTAVRARKSTPLRH